MLGATYIKARVAHRIVSRAVVVATAVTMDGNREVLGLAGAALELAWPCPQTSHCATVALLRHSDRCDESSPSRRR